MAVNFIRRSISSEVYVTPLACFNCLKFSTYLTRIKIDGNYDLDNSNFIDKSKHSYYSVSAPSKSHLDVLKLKFGIPDFKPLQWQIVKSILEERRDNYAIMPAGYGKSLCYQYPAVYSDGLSIVITPLISLMQDQVKFLEKLDIPACFLGSAQPDSSTVTKNLFEKCYRVLYMTPESALTSFGLSLIGSLHLKFKITLLAIDEAHCILQWGPDFRPAYKGLAKLRSVLPSVPILALTATATSQETDLIIDCLKLKNPQILSNGIDCPNLYYMVKQMGKEPFGDIFRVLIEYQKQLSFREGSTIIYCLTKKKTEKLAKLLNQMGVECRPYHSGLLQEVRKSVMEDFMTNKVKVIVATTAFGMGINKPDVRTIIHYGTPLSMKGYYQETGRAGRDGEPALCVLYYSLNDFITHRYINKTKIKSDEKYFKIDERNQAMKLYVISKECRRKLLLSYFDTNFSTDNYKKQDYCCDNCSTGQDICSDSNTDVTKEVELFLRGIESLKTKSFGVGKTISLLLGKNSKSNSGFEENIYFASGTNRTAEWWKQLALLLELQGYIRIYSKFVGSAIFTKVVLNDKGINWLEDNDKKIAQPIKLNITMNT